MKKIFMKKIQMYNLFLEETNNLVSIYPRMLENFSIEIKEIFVFQALLVPSLKCKKFFYKKHKSFLSLGLENWISWNIRNFFREAFFIIFWAWKVPSWNKISFFKKLHFLKNMKSFFWEKISFLILGLESCISWKEKTFFWGNITNFCKVDFLYFLSLG